MAVDINNAGRAAGQCSTYYQGDADVATRWAPPAIVDSILGSRRMSSTRAYGISDAGVDEMVEVVGEMGAYRDGQWTKAPFVWSESIEKRAGLVATSLPMENAQPYDVSDAGPITGSAGGQSFVLIPQ